MNPINFPALILPLLLHIDLGHLHSSPSSVHLNLFLFCVGNCDGFFVFKITYPFFSLVLPFTHLSAAGSGMPHMRRKWRFSLMSEKRKRKKVINGFF